jgi:hypothetical protein
VPAAAVAAETGATSAAAAAAAAPPPAATTAPAAAVAAATNATPAEEQAAATWQSASAAAFPPATWRISTAAVTHSASSSPGTEPVESSSDESIVEVAPKPYAAPDAPGAAERRAWCDQEEAALAHSSQPSCEFTAGPEPGLQLSQARPSQEATSTTDEQLTPQVRATLADLLELHEFGEHVRWPTGFDARIARQRLAPGG